MTEFKQSDDRATRGVGRLREIDGWTFSFFFLSSFPQGAMGGGSVGKQGGGETEILLLKKKKTKKVEVR